MKILVLGFYGGVKNIGNPIISNPLPILPVYLTKCMETICRLAVWGDQIKNPL